MDARSPAVKFVIQLACSVCVALAVLLTVAAVVGVAG
jgi:hypothetical protein